jgi:hypothetical protein
LVNGEVGRVRKRGLRGLCSVCLAALGIHRMKRRDLNVGSQCEQAE